MTLIFTLNYVRCRCLSWVLIFLLNQNGNIFNDTVLVLLNVFIVNLDAKRIPMLLPNHSNILDQYLVLSSQMDHHARNERNQSRGARVEENQKVDFKHVQEFVSRRFGLVYKRHPDVEW
uniref:Uncharacterized protein n=1 Tax=Cacopsylla melanoneura TaxID=428564 RepID=A0A8D9FFF1_9HEMI